MQKRATVNAEGFNKLQQTSTSKKYIREGKQEKQKVREAMQV